LGWGKTTGDPGDGNPPERGPGAEPHAVDGCLQWGENFKSRPSYKQILRILVVFHTFSPGIIPISLRREACAAEI